MCLGVSSDFTLVHCIAGFQHKSGRLQRRKLARSTWDLGIYETKVKDSLMFEDVKKSAGPGYGYRT
jgi:hypothetical protein